MVFIYNKEDTIVFFYLHNFFPSYETSSFFQIKFPKSFFVMFDVEYIFHE